MPPWGVLFLLGLAFAGVFYVAGGIARGAAIQRSVGLRVHPHFQAWRGLWGLVLDGCSFAGGGGRGGSGGARRRSGYAPAPSKAPDGAEVAVAGASASCRAHRGKAGLPLHHAASVGDGSKLAALLLHDQGGGGSRCLDSGDHRSYTPYHVACAGGHVECVSMLVAAGCDTSLINDTGVTGMELAESLRREGVVALLRRLLPQQQQQQQQQQ